MNFGKKFFYGGNNVKPLKILKIYEKKGKTVIRRYVQVENLEVFYISDEKTDLTVGFVS